MTSAALRDRDCRVQARDQVHVGLGHLSEELPGIAGKALHVTPLSLGVEGVEGQRAFARPADARKADQPVPRQLNVDVPKIMLSGASDKDVRSVHIVAASLNGRIRANPLFYQKVTASNHQ